MDAVINLFEVNLCGQKHLIITEGKTDWKHLKKALVSLKKEGRFTDLEINFLEYEDETKMGDKELLSLCNQVCKFKNNKVLICIFDRDVSDTITKVTSTTNEYKKWGNRVYSFVLPPIDFRGITSPICIEHYYDDVDLLKETEEGRRIYLGNEFSRLSGLFINGQDRFCVKKDKCGEDSIYVLDSESKVFLNNDENTNIALSKSDFAEMIFNEQLPFNSINYSNFVSIFNIIIQILEDDKTNYNFA